MEAPPGWVAKHIADVRVVGEPWAGTGMIPQGVLVNGKLTGRMRPKKAKKGRPDVHKWRAHIEQTLRNHADWNHCCTGPVIVRATLLMLRPKRMGDGGRQPFAKLEWRDIDNCMKPFQDAMTQAGVIMDDGLIYDTHVTQWYAASNEQPGLELSWWELIEKDEPSLF